MTGKTSRWLLAAIVAVAGNAAAGQETGAGAVGPGLALDEAIAVQGTEIDEGLALLREAAPDAATAIETSLRLAALYAEDPAFFVTICNRAPHSAGT